MDRRSTGLTANSAVERGTDPHVDGAVDLSLTGAGDSSLGVGRVGWPSGGSGCAVESAPLSELDSVLEREAVSAIESDARSAARRSGSMSSVGAAVMTFPPACLCRERAGEPASAAAASPGAGVGLVMDRLQPLDCHVSVELRRGQRSVTEQFLNAAKVRSAVEHVSGR